MCDELVREDWAALSHAGRIDALVALQRRISALQGAQLRLLGVLAADPATVSVRGGDDRNWAIEEVGCALRLSAGVAQARLAEASEMRRLPGAQRLLESGAISLHHARTLVEAVTPLDDAATAAVEARVIERASEQTVAAFRRSVRRAVLTYDTRTVEARRSSNVEMRRVCMRPAGEGTAELWALLPVEGAVSLLAAVDALASRPVDRCGGVAGSRTSDSRTSDSRTSDQRRADALVQLGIDALAGTISTALPRQQRMRPAVQVTVALSTLLGIDDQPGELVGFGSVPASLARRLADDPSGTWRRLVVDPMGRLVDHGRSVYRPPSALADHVIARDRTCRFPTCGRRAASCELDHSQPWGDGGTTSAENLVALCRRHHHLRHDTRWSYTRDASARDVRWRDPTGHEYAVEADTYPIDGTLPRIEQEAGQPGEQLQPGEQIQPGERDPVESDPDPPPF